VPALLSTKLAGGGERSETSRSELKLQDELVHACSESPTQHLIVVELELGSSDCRFQQRQLQHKGKVRRSQPEARTELVVNQEQDQEEISPGPSRLLGFASVWSRSTE
jgi:hypothetical protein